MTSNLNGIGTLFVGGIVFIIWIITQLWYIILPITTIILGVYFYNKYSKEKIREEQIRKQREATLKRLAREREEIKRLEEERVKRERIKKEQEIERIRKQKELQVKTRLEKFKITSNEAQLIFGKTWEKRLEKQDEYFIKEIQRIGEKLIESESYKQKIAKIMEKVFDIIDLCMHEIWGKMQNWDDIDYENWEEDWQDVKDTWKRQRHHYQDYENYSKRETSEYQKYYEILGLKVGATIKEIKAQFRKLMKKFHPDKNNSPDAEQKCKEIIEAYNKLAKIVNN